MASSRKQLPGCLGAPLSLSPLALLIVKNHHIWDMLVLVFIVFYFIPIVTWGVTGMKPTRPPFIFHRTGRSWSLVPIKADHTSGYGNWPQYWWQWPPTPTALTVFFLPIPYTHTTLCVLAVAHLSWSGGGAGKDWRLNVRQGHPALVDVCPILWCAPKWP